MWNRSMIINIRVDIPAVSDLVAYLREKDNTQAKIDAMTAKVRDLTNKLQASGAGLQDAVQNQQTES